MEPPRKPNEDKSSRGLDRLSELVKKERVFGDGNVALAFIDGDRVYDLSPGNSLARIVQGYRNQSEAEASSSTSGSGKENGQASNHQTFPKPVRRKRNFKEVDIDDMCLSDRLQVEEQLVSALRHVRALKAEKLQERRAQREKLAAASRTHGNEGTSS